MENQKQLVGETTENLNYNLDGYESGEQLVKNSQDRLTALKGLYRTQLGFDKVTGEGMSHSME